MADGQREGTRKPEVRRILSTEPAFDEVYTEILAPSFHRDELSDRTDLRRYAATGTMAIWAALDEHGQVLGAAVWEPHAEFDLVLLAWLAVRPGLRGQSIGGPLYRTSLDECVALFKPALALAEVSDPDWHGRDELHGDPAARLRFYQRHGARTLDLPYFQPALGSGRARIPHMLLLVLHVRADPAAAPEAAEQSSTRAPTTLPGTALRPYLEQYQCQCEGAVGVDKQSTLLWQALDRPGGVAYRD